MPVTGPSQDFAYRVGDEIFALVLELLKDRGVERPSLLLPLGKQLSAEWDERQRQLQETLREMVWIDHAASF